MATAMPDFDTWRSGFSEVCKILAHYDTRSRLLETCFGEFPLSYCAHLYVGFSGQIYDKRWLSACDACCQKCCKKCADQVVV